MKLKLFSAIVAVAIIGLSTMDAQASLLVESNGGIGTLLDDPPINPGDDWFATTDTPPAFFWDDGADAPNLEGPFTFNSASATRLDVTDDFLKGDVFEVFDFGVSIGFTSAVAADATSPEVGPQAAFDDATYSSGSFLLAAGAHSITIQASVNPFDGGRGYLRVLEVDQAIPEPGSLIVFGIPMLSFFAAVWFRRRKQG